MKCPLHKEIKSIYNFDDIFVDFRNTNPNIKDLQAALTKARVLSIYIFWIFIIVNVIYRVPFGIIYSYIINGSDFQKLLQTPLTMIMKFLYRSIFLIPILIFGIRIKKLNQGDISTKLEKINRSNLLITIYFTLYFILYLLIYRQIINVFLIFLLIYIGRVYYFSRTLLKAQNNNDKPIDNNKSNQNTNQDPITDPNTIEASIVQDQRIPNLPPKTPNRGSLIQESKQTNNSTKNNKTSIQPTKEFGMPTQP